MHVRNGRGGAPGDIQFVGYARPARHFAGTGHNAVAVVDSLAWIHGSECQGHLHKRESVIRPM